MTRQAATKLNALPRSCRTARDTWQSCRSRGGGEVSNAPTLIKIVAAYRRAHQEGARAELDYYRYLPSMADAIARAARAQRPDGKRHDHQRLITKRAMERVSTRLPRLKLSGIRTFEDLHQRIEALIGRVHGVGPLMVYDTTLRIGAKLGLEPDYVYLHAGTRDGARALGLGGRRAFLSTNQLPTPLRRLKPREIEDLLCIYKEELKRVRALANRRTVG